MLNATQAGKPTGSTSNRPPLLPLSHPDSNPCLSRDYVFVGVVARYDLLGRERVDATQTCSCAPSPREPPLRRAVATTPARPRAAVPRRARRALAATSARAHRCLSIGRPSRG